MAKSGKDHRQNRENRQDEYEGEPLEMHDTTGDQARQSPSERSQSVCRRMAAGIQRGCDKAANDDQAGEQQRHGDKRYQKRKRRKVVHRFAGFSKARPNCAIAV